MDGNPVIRLMGLVAIFEFDTTAEITSTRQRRLLAALAVSAPDVVSVERLVDIVWAGAPPESAPRTLQSYVSRLRSRLAGEQPTGGSATIVRAEPGYALAESMTSDASVFETLVSTAADAMRAGEFLDAAAIFERALAMWRGEPIAEFADEDWARAYAHGLAERRVAAVEDLAECELRLGHAADSITRMEQLAVEYPLRERPRALLMRSLYAAGRQAEALRAYRDFYSLLSDEIGLVPSEKLVQLEAQIATGALLDDDHAASGTVAGALPSGTVTFLFTDIEGSTPLWDAFPGAMGTALARHDEILRSAIAVNGGYVFSTAGDGVGAVFSRAANAIDAALQAQRELCAEEWVGGPVLRVRMGLHTGTAEERDGNYFGRTLNRAARIMSAGHGGQIVLSDVTAGLVRDDAELSDLGDHRLAGVEALMRLWQFGRETFPPLKTVTVATGNLPVPLDCFVGRRDEIAKLLELLTTHQLVTVVGVGGMGKTRLVVEALHRSQLDAADGVWFADLSVAQSEQAVVDEVAALFGLQQSPGRSVEDRLVEHLEAKRAVLVFDNCEHVTGPAAGLIDRLLHASSLLKIVATSREALMLRGEHVMALGPLPTEPATNDHVKVGDDGEVDVEVDVDAVELFVERLVAEGGSVDLARHDRAVIVDICRQLDGMPLAIELAAARARTLGASGVLARLGDSLRLLSGGWRTGVGRQQTLSATLDWSYALLDDHEQVVFDRLAVFVGWLTLDDAVAVASGPGLDQHDVIDALSGLVDKSMCASDITATPARYRYLETMRSYGRDHLIRAGTLVELRDQHATYMAAVARRVRTALVGPDELEASREAERIIADLRSALGWSVERHFDRVINGIAGLAPVMAFRGAYEMSSWFYDLRDDLPDSPSVQVVAVQHALMSAGDVAETRRLCQRIMELHNGALAGVAWRNLGIVAFNEGEYEQAIEYQLRAYDLGEAAHGGPFSHVLNPMVLAMVLSATGQDATEFIEQALERANGAEWPTGIAGANCAAGEALLTTDAAASLVALDRAIHVAAGVGSRYVETMAMNFKIVVISEMLPAGELAVEHIDLLRRLQQIGDTNTTLLALSNVITWLDKAHRQSTAAVVYGWLDGRSGLNTQSVGEHHATVSTVRRSVGDQWDLLVDRGRTMTRSQIVDYVCEELATIE